MRATVYRVESRWRLRGEVTQIAAVFQDAESWARWWPAAFLEVRSFGCGAGAGISGARIRSKGWLPYTLRLEALVERCDFPHACRFRVRGDFEGACDCSLRQDGGDVELRFDWHVRVHKPLLRALSWALKPLFVANHRWVMRQGRRSLEIELARRQAASLGVPFELRPPGPTFPYGDRWRAPARFWLVVARRFDRVAEGRLEEAR